MEGLSGGMRSLCDDIVISREDRKKQIKDLRQDAKSIRDNAAKFVSDSNKSHKKMAEELKKGLVKGREELVEKVGSLRKDFRQKEKDIRSDLAEAGKIWKGVKETMTAKTGRSKT